METTTEPAVLGRGEACACCNRAVPADGPRYCAWCLRPVCVACLRTYGHYQLVCEECHLGDW